MRLTISVCLTAFITLIPLLPSPAFARQQLVSPRLRALDPLVAETVEVGQHWSPTVRSLTEALEQSNLIVHIVPQPMGCRSSGALHFVSTRGGHRFVRVAIDTSLPLAERVALLAHELQHATEVAGEPDVQDRASFEDLYRRIGKQTRHGVPIEYETDAAIRIGRLVYREVAAQLSNR